MVYGLCPKCGEIGKLSKHHVYPKRFFGSKNNRIYLFICTRCHRELEKNIPLDIRLERPVYEHIVKVFLLKNQEYRVH